MNASTVTTRPARLITPPSPVRTAPQLAPLARAGVFIALATSGIVFSEPAPVDLVILVLLGLLPLAGLTALAPGMTLQFLLLLGCGAGALIASGLSLDVDVRSKHPNVLFI